MVRILGWHLNTILYGVYHLNCYRVQSLGHSVLCLTLPLALFAAFEPPMDVSVQGGSECYTSVVSWLPPHPVCGATFMIENYSVRYQLMNGGAFTTVISPSTSVTLQGLMVNTEYSVSVAAISSSGNMSAFTGPTQFVLQGDVFSVVS